MSKCSVSAHHGGHTYVAAALYGIGLWAIPEGSGGPYPHSATDVGSGILYAVVFAALYQLDTFPTRARGRWTRSSCDISLGGRCSPSPP